MTTGDAEELAQSVRARVATAAPRAAAIWDLADREIAEIRDLAERAGEAWRHVDLLMQQLSELLEQERGDGHAES